MNLSQARDILLKASKVDGPHDAETNSDLIQIVRDFSLHEESDKVNEALEVLEEQERQDEALLQALNAPPNALWFVKYEDIKALQTIVFTFTMPWGSTDAQAFEQGRSMINPDYAANFRNERAEFICPTTATVLCFEPC